MRWLLSISFLIFFFPVFSQQDPENLSRKLTSPCKTEYEKVKAIFDWITHNISYSIKPKGKIAGYVSVSDIKSKNETEWMDNGPEKSLVERVAETTLLRKQAVCDGYARLFTSLCDHAGIRSEIIVGYAKSGSNKPMQRFGVNHYWNAVQIDGKWYLLDATWASGYVNMRGDEFIRDYDEKYFLTPPEVFILDHYPDDARWTLLPDSKIPQEFSRSPFKQKSFIKYQFTSFYPQKGIIEARVGDTIYFRLENGIQESERNISPGTLVDSSFFSHSASWVFLKPDYSEKTASKHSHTYIYNVTSPEVEWLYLVYNDDLVLRYKIQVKKKKA